MKHIINIFFITFLSFDAFSQSSGNDSIYISTIFRSHIGHDFLLGKKKVICSDIKLQDNLLTNEPIPFSISDSILPISKVWFVFKRAVDNENNCFNRYKEFLEIVPNDSLVIEKGYSFNRTSKLIIYRTQLIGPIQPYIVIPIKKRSLIFEKVKFGKIIYLFVGTRSDKTIIVFGTTIIYN